MEKHSPLTGVPLLVYKRVTFECYLEVMVGGVEHWRAGFSRILKRMLLKSMASLKILRSIDLQVVKLTRLIGVLHLESKQGTYESYPEIMAEAAAHLPVGFLRIWLVMQRNPISQTRQLMMPLTEVTNHPKYSLV